MQHDQGELWFTSSTSTTLLDDGAAFSGLYRCSLDKITGICENPSAIANGWFRDGRFHHDMPMMNVMLNEGSFSNSSSSRFIYSRTHDKHRKSWDLIRAPLDTLNFESYFRTEETFDWNECHWDCCDDRSGDSYARVTPKSYLVDGDEVFVAWDGFYKKCEGTNHNSTTGGLVWTIGISRLLKTPDCILNGGDEEQNFALCTHVVSIVHQNTAGRTRALPYGGFAVTRAPVSGRRVFLMTGMRSEGVEEFGKLTSEIWIFPEEVDCSSFPDELQSIAPTEVRSAFFDEEIQDAGSLRLHKDGNGMLDHLCRTAFDHGVSCFPIGMDEDGRVVANLDKEFVFVNSSQVQESCQVELYRNKPYFNQAATVTTGLEILWNSSGQPEKVFFGCIGGIGGNGNFTTADRDGNLVATLPGAFPGRILFGPAMLGSFSTSADEPAMLGSFSTSADELELFDQPIWLNYLGALFLLLVSYLTFSSLNRRFCADVQDTADAYKYEGMNVGIGDRSDVVSGENVYTPSNCNRSMRSSYIELSSLSRITLPFSRSTNTTRM
jgi:hypothetical protein